MPGCSLPTGSISVSSQTAPSFFYPHVFYIIFLKKKVNYPFSFYIPLPPLVPFPPPFSPSPSPHLLLREGKAHCSEEGPRPSPTISRLSKAYPKRMKKAKRPVQTAGINPGTTASDPTVCPSHTAVTHIQGV